MNKFFFFISFLFLLTFTPIFGALDRATIQWFLLSVFSFVFISLKIKTEYLKNFNFLIYLFFLFQIFLSLIYTNNLSISLVDLSRHITVFVLITICISLLNTNTFSFYKLSIIVSIALLFESIFSLSPVFYYIYNNGFNFSLIDSVDINVLKGITGNRNITTASLVIKFPFLFYLFLKSKISFKPFILFLALFPSLSLFLINSRAALLSFSIFLLFIPFYFLFYKRDKIIQAIYFYSPIVFAYIFSLIILPSKSSNAIQNLSSIKFTSESSNYRFELWANALDFISNNLFIGCGIGNWKVESAFYWGSIGSDYLVPYHAHNDFLEFSSEIGIIGGLTYLFLFVFVLYNFFNLFFVSKDLKFFILFFSFFALLIDSSLNFPFERPIIQVMFVLLISLSIYFNHIHNEKEL